MLWESACNLTIQKDSAVYKDIVLPLLFFKFISDNFVEQQNKVLEMVSNPDSDYYLGDDPKDHQEALENRDYYTKANLCWVPKDARWEKLRNYADQIDIVQVIDKALFAIENEKNTISIQLQLWNAELKRIFSSHWFSSKENPRDICEYFLGHLYTPIDVIKTLVAILSPDKGRLYDPCCGLGGMFIQSERFIEKKGGRKDDISFYGQESNPTTWKLSSINLENRGLITDLGQESADTFARDQHPDKKFDYILANPPFNTSDWGGENYERDTRWVYGIPPAGNANYAWLQHVLWKLKPGGQAGVVLANGSMRSNFNNEGKIREEMIKKDVVEVMISFPGNLFLNSQIPVCLWFLTNDKTQKGRNRKGETLFIDAKQMGTTVSKQWKMLTDKDISRISETVQSWRNEKDYADVPGFSYGAKFEEIKKNNYILTPASYVGVLLDFEEELTKLVFGDDLEFIYGEELELDFEQQDAFEYNNPVDTVFIGNYSEIIQGTAHGEWKCESDYYVCKVSKDNVKELQKMKFLQDLKGGDIYVLFSIRWDDNWSHYCRDIYLVKECESMEIAEKLLPREFALDCIKGEDPGVYYDFLKQFLN